MSEQAASAAEESSSPPNVDIPEEPPVEEAAETAASEAEAEEDQEPEQPGYESAEFESLNADETVEPIEPNLDVILNIPVTLSMQIGSTRMTIEELMRLNRGSVVKLDRLAGEPMDVLVNGTLIAHGEVVVVNDKFGIRLLDVISPAERVKKLR
ncbi:flagellar motor switch protein FliN [Thiolapillus sp.]